VNRDEQLARLAAERFDILVVGGGATGLGAAVDAAARGYRTALIETGDFANATSSRSTKLVHGGVRYLRQGNVALVREALHERTLLRRNAPHLVDELRFVVPAYRGLEIPYYAVGLGAYDLLAGASGFRRSSVIGPARTRALVPTIATRHLRGAVAYSDGRFDDARLALTLARTAVDRGAVVANYVRAMEFRYENGRVRGVVAIDRETERSLDIRARAVINATGIFGDAVRALDDPHARPLLRHSRGSHVVVAREVLGPSETALLVPRTPDGRVLFAIPWHQRVLIGTTDVADERVEPDPVPTGAEIAYIVETANRYLARPIAENQILSAFAGLRPLLSGSATQTAALSREHAIEVSRFGLVTIAGGKWTTYRAMAEQVVDVAMREGGLTPALSTTRLMPLHGAFGPPSDDETLRVYGTDAAEIAQLVRADPAIGTPLHPRLPYTRALVVYAARAEMARSVEDVLARRTRALALDAAAAFESASEVAALLASELGRDATWQGEQIEDFTRAAQRASPRYRPGLP
jgi:glycerol-3-phosphate dehydrogenase